MWTHWLKAVGHARGPLPARWIEEGRTSVLREGGFPRRPRVSADDRLVLYASVWRRVFGVVVALGEPYRSDRALNRPPLPTPTHNHALPLPATELQNARTRQGLAERADIKPMMTGTDADRVIDAYVLAFYDDPTVALPHHS